MIKEIIGNKIWWNLEVVGETPNKIPKEVKGANPPHERQQCRSFILIDSVVEHYVNIEWRDVMLNKQRGSPKAVVLSYFKHSIRN